MKSAIFCLLLFFLFRKILQLQPSKPRLYVAGLPECPPHSIQLKARFLILTVVYEIK